VAEQVFDLSVKPCAIFYLPVSLLLPHACTLPDEQQIFAVFFPNINHVDTLFHLGELTQHLSLQLSKSTGSKGSLLTLLLSDTLFPNSNQLLSFTCSKRLVFREVRHPYISLEIEIMLVDPLGLHSKLFL